MRITVVGAGAMGSTYGGLLRRAGCDVTLVDVWPEHVEAINRDGLRLSGVDGDLRVAIPALREPEAGGTDVAFVQVNAYDTASAAQTAARALKPDGYAITFQNGVGNLETLQRVLGPERVLGGLSYHSAAMAGPGHALHTHRGRTWIGELNGSRTPRLGALNDALQAAGLQPTIVDDILSFIYTKLVLNSAINPICAAMGIRVGEIPRTPGADELQTRIIEEALGILKAKGIRLADPDVMGSIKAHCQAKFNKPSMLQHMEQGKQTEIDALNGAIARMGQELNVPAPCNQALAWMVQGINRQRRRAMHEPPPDYDALEKQAKARHR